MCVYIVYTSQQTATSGVTVATIVYVCPATMTFEIPQGLLNSITNHLYDENIPAFV